jgi:hypothetical protein
VSRRPAITEAEKVRQGLRDLLADHGWAIAMHGSYARDFDFIAVPWAETAPTEIGGLVKCIETEFDRMAKGPTWKPHGRLAWAFIARTWPDGPMPRVWDVSFVDPRNAIARAFPKLRVAA